MRGFTVPRTFGSPAGVRRYVSRRRPASHATRPHQLLGEERLRPARRASRSAAPSATWHPPRPWAPTAAGSRRLRTVGHLPSATLSNRMLSRPVLKHGPRSLTCARVAGIFSKPKGAAKAGRTPSGVAARRMARLARARTPGVPRLRPQEHPERTRWDPKDGELCPARTKSGETLMEVRSDSDVQIDRQSWV